METLKPVIDDQFKEILASIKLVENNRSLLKERKIQSHEAKKRDPTLNDTYYWHEQMEEDYNSYKRKVKRIHGMKVKQEKAERAAKWLDDTHDIMTQEFVRFQAITAAADWFNCATE